MIKRLWLLYAQVCTVGLALIFVVATLKPDWLQGSGLAGLGFQQGLPGALVGGGQGPAVLQTDLPPPASSLREAVRLAMPAVVYVNTQRARQPHPLIDDPVLRRFFGDRLPGPDDDVGPGQGLGSGVIVSPDGIILTNHHVVEGAESFQVTFSDGRQLDAELMGSDPESDLAVLRVKATNLPTIVFGRPSELQVGDTVLAIGNPFGVGLTVTQGIVSALGRTEPELATFGDFIQTDAAINPGNSGGALVDANGALVGINTAIISRDGGSLGIGFAISADLARRVMESIVSTGKVSRGFLGVEPQDVNEDIAQTLKLPSPQGSIIARIAPGGPADRAGLSVGDVVVSINGQAVRNRRELLAQVAGLTPGTKAQVTVIRQGARRELTVTLAERPTGR